MMCVSRRATAVTSSATHMLAILDAKPLARRELLDLAQAKSTRPATIDFA